MTGAAGFAGGHLLQLLVHDTPELVAWHRPGGTPPFGIAGVRWQPIDLLDREAVQAQLARLGPARVYHCAGAAHVGRSWDSSEPTFQSNVRATHHVLEGLRRAGVEARVLIPSSALVYAASAEPIRETDRVLPGSPYALSKLAQEQLAADYPGGPQVLIARSFNHFGPRQDPYFALSGFARRIADLEAGRWAPEITAGNLEARRDMTDVRDTVRAYQLILEKGEPGRPYNVCSGSALSIGGLLEKLLSRARVPITARVDPARYRPNDHPLVLGDPSRIREELQWAPRLPLEQSLEDLLEYWRHVSKPSIPAP